MRLLQARTEQDPRDGFGRDFFSAEGECLTWPSGGLRIPESTDCRGCHSNEPISGNPWSINSCDKDWRRGPCSTGIGPVFQLPSSSSSARALSSFDCNSKHASTRGSSMVHCFFFGCASCNREYGMKKGTLVRNHSRLTRTDGTVCLCLLFLIPPFHNSSSLLPPVNIDPSFRVCSCDDTKRVHPLACAETVPAGTFFAMYRTA